jgi:hypothetical protein
MQIAAVGKSHADTITVSAVLSQTGQRFRATCLLVSSRRW